MAKDFIWIIPENNSFPKEYRPEEIIGQLERAQKFWQEHWLDFANFWLFYISTLRETRKTGCSAHSLYVTMQRKEVIFYLGEFSNEKNLLQLFRNDFRANNIPKGIQCFFEGNEIPDIIKKTYIAMQNNSFGKDMYLEIILSLKPFFLSNTSIDTFEEVSKKIE